MAAVLRHVAVVASLWGILQDKGQFLNDPLNFVSQFVLQRCSLVACRELKSLVDRNVVLFACIGPSLLWVFVRFFKACWLQKKKKKTAEDGLADDAFLRICSKVRCRMLDLCASWWHPAPGACLPPNQEGADCVILLCCRIIYPTLIPAELWMISRRTAIAGSNQLIGCQLTEAAMQQ